MIQRRFDHWLIESYRAWRERSAVRRRLRRYVGTGGRQLDLPTRPPRARAQRLAETIERVLVGHYDAHRSAIEAKLR